MCRAAFRQGGSVERENGPVQKGREEHPCRIGQEHQRRCTVRAPACCNEGGDRCRQKQDDQQGEPHLMQHEEGRRPGEVQNELKPPEPHRHAMPCALPCPCARHRDQHIENGPDRREHPVWRVEGRLCQRRIPGAGRGDVSDGETRADNEKQKDRQDANDGHGLIRIDVLEGRWLRASVQITCPFRCGFQGEVMQKKSVLPRPQWEPQGEPQGEQCQFTGIIVLADV